ncbi:MAG: hypothetical protein ABGW77_06740 [Campylobacterales bacterium]
MELKISITIEKLEVKVEGSQISISIGGGNPMEGKGEEGRGEKEGGRDEVEKGEGLQQKVREGVSNSTEIVQQLLEWLKERGFQIKNYSTGEEVEQVLKIAYKLGEKYQLLRPFYLRLKSILGQGGEFTLKMKEFPSVQISEILNFCRQLQELGFISYTYKNSPSFTLRVFFHPNPTGINLFSGHWLEKWAKLKIVEELKRKGLNFGYLQELQVELPDQKDDEFDLLFEVEGERFIVECKTANFEDKIQKFSERAGKFLGLPPNRRIFLLLEASEEQRRGLVQLYNLQVESLESFPTGIKKLIEEIGEKGKEKETPPPLPLEGGDSQKGVS